MKEHYLLMAVYSSVEYYPPSLNALKSLNKYFGKISILSRNVRALDWDYTSNVDNILSGEFTPIREVEQKPMYWKVLSFLQYTWNMWRIINNYSPQVVILYDSIPTLSYYLISLFHKKKHILWYHNHDVIDASLVQKYSISWWSVKIEKKLFQYVDIFSLPTNERKMYFPLQVFKGKYYFIPNLPSKEFYNTFYQKKSLGDNEIKLLYQGTVSEGHGLVQIIKYLVGNSIADKMVTLTLVGWITQDYKDYLLKLARELGKENFLFIKDIIPYKQLPLFTRKNHIGIAIHEPINPNFITAGTASNKIYEYAALGLPVLLYKSEHYQKNLANYSWAYFTDLSETSLKNCLSSIVDNYTNLSVQAHEDFIKELNFETHFTPVVEDLQTMLDEIK